MSANKNSLLNNSLGSPNVESYERDRLFTQSVAVDTIRSLDSRTQSFSRTSPFDLQPLRGSLVLAETNLLLPTVKFVTEDKFKKDNDCFVCKISFGNFKDRQHHCRLCGHSCCALCSSRAINSHRVCDVCFLKATQINYEKKRKKYLKTMKEHIEKMKQHVKAGNNKIVQLKQQIETQNQKLDEELEILRIQSKDLEVKLKQLEHEKANLTLQLKEQNEIIEPKLDAKEKLSMQEAEIDQKLRQIDVDLYLKQQTLEEKQQQFEKMQKYLQELETSDSFLYFSKEGKIDQKYVVNNSRYQLSEASGEIDSSLEKQQSSSLSNQSKARANKLYDSQFMDTGQIEQFMNPQQQQIPNKKHNVRERDNQNTQNGGGGCADAGCIIF